MILSTKLFTPEGTYLGLNTLDGMVLAGGEFHGTVTFILDVEFLDK